MPTPGEHRYIHGTASTEQDRLRRLNQLTNAAFLSFLPLRPGQNVLELGSGLGILAAEVGVRVAPGLAVGLEVSEAQLRSAPSTARALCFVRADAHAPPFRERTFDLAYCRFLLEHVHDPMGVLTATYTVLKPGGVVCVQENTILVNAFDPECPTFDLVWRQFVELQKRLGGDAMIGKKLFRLLSQAGFSEVALSLAPEIYRAGQPGYGLWIENLAGNIESAEEALLSHGYCSQEEITKAYEELAALAKHPHGAAWFYWNRATARRTLT